MVCMAGGADGGNLHHVSRKKSGRIAGGSLARTSEDSLALDRLHDREARVEISDEVYLSFGRMMRQAGRPGPASNHSSKTG